MKKVFIFCITILMAAFLSGCSYIPEVTGTADDGLWIYEKNLRFRSDLSGRQTLVSSMTVNGVLYEDLYIFDTKYSGDTVFMCALYPLPVSEDVQTDEKPEYGSCLIRYDLKEKTAETFFDGGTEYDISEIYYASAASDRVLLLTRKGFIVVKNGELVEVCEDDLRQCRFTDDYIFRVNNGFVEERTWDSAVWTKVEGVAENADSIFMVDDILMICTVYKIHTNTGEYIRSYCGLYAYAPQTKNLKRLADASQMQTARPYSKYGYYLITNADERTHLRHFDSAEFTDREISEIDKDEIKSWEIMFAKQGSYVMLEGYDGNKEGADKYATFRYDIQKYSWLKADLDAFPADSNFIVENAEYYFYYTIHKLGLGFGDKEIALHRIRKSNGQDDVMYVGTNYIYNFDALRYD